MNTQNLLPRVGLYTLGMLLMAIGVNISVTAGLGVSPVNSFPYVVSLVIGVDTGTCVSALFVFLVLVQIIILRKEFPPIQLTQIIFSVIFGYFVDWTYPLISLLETDTYILRALLSGTSMVTLSFGLTVYLRAKLVPMPMEGLNLAIAGKTHIAFYKVKMTADVGFITASVLVSWFGLGGLVGIREGSIVAAYVVGRLVPVMKKLLDKILGPDD